MSNVLDISKLGAKRKIVIDVIKVTSLRLMKVTEEGCTVECKMLKCLADLIDMVMPGKMGKLIEEATKEFVEDYAKYLKDKVQQTSEEVN